MAFPNLRSPRGYWKEMTFYVTGGYISFPNLRSPRGYWKLEYTASLGVTPQVFQTFDPPEDTESALLGVPLVVSAAFPNLRSPRGYWKVYSSLFVTSPDWFSKPSIPQRILKGIDLAWDGVGQVFSKPSIPQRILKDQIGWVKGGDGPVFQTFDPPEDTERILLLAIRFLTLFSKPSIPQRILKDLLLNGCVRRIKFSKPSIPQRILKVLICWIMMKLGKIFQTFDPPEDTERKSNSNFCRRFCFFQTFDPPEDTERGWLMSPTGRSSLFQTFDPPEDTERIAQDHLVA